MSDAPQGPGWWLGQDGKYYPPSAVPGQPRKQSKTSGLGKVIVLIGLLFIVFLAIAALTSPKKDTATPPPATTAPPTTAAALATSTTIAPTSPGCEPATPTEVQVIEAGLTGKAKRLGEAFAAVDAQRRRIISANMYPATGDRMSSADVWIIADGKIYALSSDARKSSSFPDGRQLPGNPSAGDEISFQLQGCIVNSLRAENGAEPLPSSTYPGPQS